MWYEPERDCNHSGDVKPVTYIIPFLPLHTLTTSPTALPIQNFRISKQSAKDQQLGAGKAWRALAEASPPRAPEVHGGLGLAAHISAPCILGPDVVCQRASALRPAEEVCRAEHVHPCVLVLRAYICHSPISMYASGLQLDERCHRPCT
jgi:hypothetical protein